jgi:hypothetical protein
MSDFKADLAAHVIARVEFFNTDIDSLRIGAKADVLTLLAYAEQDIMNSP